MMCCVQAGVEDPNAGLIERKVNLNAALLLTKRNQTENLNLVKTQRHKKTLDKDTETLI